MTKKQRMAAKTSTYAIMHMAVAISVAYAITGNWAISLGIGLIEPFVQTIAFTVHEWVWERRTPTTREAVTSTLHLHQHNS